LSRDDLAFDKARMFISVRRVGCCRNVRRDPLLIDNPIGRLGRAIGRIGGKVLRLEIKRSSVRSIIAFAAPTSA
jgi:hypothetical protein